MNTDGGDILLPIDEGTAGGIKGYWGKSMNTNETQEIEIPTEEEWDVTVQAAERRGYRAGVEDVMLHARRG